MRKMHVIHEQREEKGMRYEVTKIFSPSNRLKPVEVLERDYPANFLSKEEGAIQSVVFGLAVANKLAKKYRAQDLTVESNVPNIARMCLDEWRK